MLTDAHQAEFWTLVVLAWGDVGVCVQRGRPYVHRRPQWTPRSLHRGSEEDKGEMEFQTIDEKERESSMGRPYMALSNVCNREDEKRKEGTRGDENVEEVRTCW